MKSMPIKGRVVVNNNHLLFLIFVKENWVIHALEKIDI